MASGLLRVTTAVILLCQTQTSALRPSQYGSGPGSNFPPTSRANSAFINGNTPVSAETPTYYDDNGNDNDQYQIPNEEHQSVEERLQSWRTQQQYKYEHQNEHDAANPRQEDGKMKLLASVSKGSIAMFFFILMWRSVHHYEMADLAFQGQPSKRMVMVLPCVILFLGNMAGCVGSILSSGALGKKRMKGILNLNKLMEVSLMAYNVMRLVVIPSKLVPREIFVGRTLSNFLFLVQCQLFTKVTWNSTKLRGDTAGDTTYGNTGDYGDYSADAGMEDMDLDGGEYRSYQQGYDYGNGVNGNGNHGQEDRWR